MYKRDPVPNPLPGRSLAGPGPLWRPPYHTSRIRELSCVVAARARELMIPPVKIRTDKSSYASPASTARRTALTRSSAGPCASSAAACCCAAANNPGRRAASASATPPAATPPTPRRKAAAAAARARRPSANATPNRAPRASARRARPAPRARRRRARGGESVEAEGRLGGEEAASVEGGDGGEAAARAPRVGHPRGARVYNPRPSSRLAAAWSRCARGVECERDDGEQ